MATLRQRFHRKNASGTYDTIYLETCPEVIVAGTLGGKVLANASAVSAIGDKQIRNIYAGTSDIGTNASLPTGDIYLVYE